MVEFLAELRDHSLEDLIELLESYFVRSHSGHTFQGTLNKPEILQYIYDWLQPESGIIYDHNYIFAIKEGYLVKNISIDLMDQIFGDLTISHLALRDFESYPMTNYFGSSWDLLQEYVHRPDRDHFFLETTMIHPELFLNHVERVFYLTRGYGRPNPQISYRDLEARKFYSNVVDSSLIGLMDLFGICPTNQDPQLIKEHFSGANLASIDRYHSKVVHEVSNCLITKVNVNCFKSLLSKMGILPIVEWDPINKVFVSNLSQLNLYRHIKPDRWDFDQVKNLDNSLVEKVIARLSDEELLNIEVFSYKLRDLVDLSKLENRLRSNLVRVAKEFLQSKQFIISGDKIMYGRLIDSPAKVVDIETLTRTDTEFVDQDGQTYSIDEIQQLTDYLNR